MLIIPAGMMKQMSTIITLCGTNFCMMAADSRLSLIDDGGNWVPSDDNYQKIFRVNDGVLFGAVGRLWKNETVDAPLCDRNDITLSQAVHLTEAYIISNIRKVDVFPRKYIVVGRGDEGYNAIATISYNAKMHGCDIQELHVKDGVQTMIALPRSLEDEKSAGYVSQRLNRDIREAKSLDELRLRVAKLVDWIARHDDEQTVGGDVRIYTLTD